MSVVDELAHLAPAPLPRATWQLLERSYATPPRAYHTLEHVLDVARHWAGERWRQPVETYLAVLFHDAVYVAGAIDNEQRSADLVEPARAKELIVLTARHGSLTPPDVDDEAARFLDCDMAILGAPPDLFDRYQQQVRAEYLPVVGPEAYAEGRRAFLEALLGRERIFLSDGFHRRLDAPARANLRRALAR